MGASEPVRWSKDVAAGMHACTACESRHPSLSETNLLIPVGNCFHPLIRETVLGWPLWSRRSGGDLGRPDSAIPTFRGNSPPVNAISITGQCRQGINTKPSEYVRFQKNQNVCSRARKSGSNLASEIVALPYHE